MTQHLAEPLQKELEKIVQRESNYEWAQNLQSGKLMRIRRHKVEKPLLGLVEVFKAMRP